MARPVIDTTVVEALVMELLVDAATGMDLVGPEETAPQPGDHGQTNAWVKLHYAEPVPGSSFQRPGTDETAHEAVVIKLTVGAPQALVDRARGGHPARLTRDATRVRAALDGTQADHPATTHRVQIGQVNPRPVPLGEHPAHRVVVLTATARVYRETAGAPVLDVSDPDA